MAIKIAFPALAVLYRLLKMRHLAAYFAVNISWRYNAIPFRRFPLKNSILS
jgi:predicted DNA-binding transcriptional regulator AlpA